VVTDSKILKRDKSKGINTQEPLFVYIIKVSTALVVRLQLHCVLDQASLPLCHPTLSS